MEWPLDKKLGALPTATGVEFSVYSKSAERIELCIYEQDGITETKRITLYQNDDHIFKTHVANVTVGAKYGYRAHGAYEPNEGKWFDPKKLLLDPYATKIDRPFSHSPLLYETGADTCGIMPKAIVSKYEPIQYSPPIFQPGGLIYEINVRAFSILNRNIPEQIRGTIAALAHPVNIAYFQTLGISAIELIPITAWIDERHLAPLKLHNSWGYNPVGFMALDPRLAPNGVEELRSTVSALRQAGIGVILDLVFNHTGESDRYGATLSMRGIDNTTYYRHNAQSPLELINDSGTGNTIACDQRVVQELVIDSLQHFVINAGVDGFRFDLAPILGRTDTGFQTNASLLTRITQDAILQGRILIAEPWDIGKGGYQLGNFPHEYLEWNDRARDDIRQFWRGDNAKTGALANALAGSSNIFQTHGQSQTRSVNFIAAHDGFTLFDLVSHEQKHNHANGEHNHDGHNENFSWNNGEEGPTHNPLINQARTLDIKALLSTLFVSRGSIMLTAGDEGGRTQNGNNNAYCQDNPITWINWDQLNTSLMEHTSWLSSLRQRFTALQEQEFLTGQNNDVEWLNSGGMPMSISDWESPQTNCFAMVLKTHDNVATKETKLAIIFNASHQSIDFKLPDEEWIEITNNENHQKQRPARSVSFFHS